MTQDLLAATVRLAETLTAENVALEAMNLPRAAAMLAEKEAALASFKAAQTSSPNTPALRQAASRLLAAGDENRRLLERAIAVQTRVLGIVAQAARAANPAPARYGRTGSYAARPPAAVALSARV